MDMKSQILAYVLQIDDLKAQMAKHWMLVQKSIADGNVDDAISLLNAYFSLKAKLEGVEANLQGILRGYFADK